MSQAELAALYGLLVVACEALQTEIDVRENGFVSESFGRATVRSGKSDLRALAHLKKVERRS
jgi:hypothetical protein